MSERLHRVMVSQGDIAAYEKRGYRQTALDPADHLDPDLWNLLMPEAKKGVVIMEIAREEFAKLNSYPKRFILKTTESYGFMHGYQVVPVDLMEIGLHTSMLADKAGAFEWPTEGMAESPREIVLKMKSHLVRDIDRLRAIATELENFLRGHDAL